MTTTAQRGGGRLVGARYALEALVGRGGMGEVWRARHVALGTRVAIKFLQGAAEPSERARRRFLTEAQVTANLRTRNAVQVFDFGVTEDGRPYLVMELLEGETLDKRIARQGRLPLATTSLFLQKAARALERAHALGIVHRDFKPENIMLVADEEDGGELVKVVDFGIAKLVGDLDATLKGALASLVQGRRPSYAPALEASGDGLGTPYYGVGTPYYMAPEQVEDSATVGPAADIWAFGVVAYECVTGRRPYDDESIAKVLLRVVAAAPPAPASSLAPVPARFDDWFRVACARDPADRFPDVQTAAAALVFALDTSLPAAPPTLRGGPARELQALAPSAAVAPVRVPEAAPTLSSRREETEAAPPRSAARETPADEPSSPAPASSPSHVSPLAATLDPLPAPREPAAPPSAPAPRSLRVLPAAAAFAAAAMAIVLAVHDDPDRRAAPVAVVQAAARALPPIVAIEDRPLPAPVEPAVASSAPSPEPTALPSATPRRRSRPHPSEATPSAYRLPPLGL